MNFLKDKFSRGKKSSEQHQGNIKFSEDHPGPINIKSNPKKPSNCHSTSSTLFYPIISIYSSSGPVLKETHLAVTSPISKLFNYSISMDWTENWMGLGSPASSNPGLVTSTSVGQLARQGNCLIYIEIRWCYLRISGGLLRISGGRV